MMRITTLTAAALASLFLAACSPEDSGASGMGTSTTTEGTASFFAPLSPKNYVWFTVIDDKRAELHLMCPVSVPGCTTVKRGDHVRVVSEVQRVHEPTWTKDPIEAAVVQSITIN